MSKGREVLSQNQIDSLLSSMNSGDSAVKKAIQAMEFVPDVDTYDFHHPSKFSRDHIQTLHGVHESYARLLGTFLSTQMRLSVQLDVASVEQQSYEDFMGTMTAPTVLMLYQLLPYEGNLMVEMSIITAISLIERMLGGPGRYIGRARELTEIEQSLIQSLMNQGMKIYSEAWKNTQLELKPEFYTFESNPQFVQMASPSDSVVVISYLVKVGEGTGSLRLCLPYPSMEPILEKMNPKYGGQIATEAGAESSKVLQSLLNQVEVNLSLVLGYADITVSDLLHLQVGDVLSLDSYIHQELPITIESCCKYYGRPGKMGKHIATQITQVLDEEG